MSYVSTLVVVRHTIVVFKSLSHVQLFCDPMDCILPGSSVHGISQQEYWSGLSFPFPRDLPNPGIETESPALQVNSLPLSPKGSKTCDY